MALELEPLCSQRKRVFVTGIQRRNVFCWLVRVLHGVKICTFGPGVTAACHGALPSGYVAFPTGSIPVPAQGSNRWPRRTSGVVETVSRATPRTPLLGADP